MLNKVLIQNIRLKTKNTEHTERLKTSDGKKMQIYINPFKQNNDHTFVAPLKELEERIFLIHFPVSIFVLGFNFYF